MNIHELEEQAFQMAAQWTRDEGLEGFGERYFIKRYVESRMTGYIQGAFEGLEKCGYSFDAACDLLKFSPDERKRAQRYLDMASKEAFGSDPGSPEPEP